MTSAAPNAADRRRLRWTFQLGGWAAFGAAMSLGRLGEQPPPLIAVSEWSLATTGCLVTLGLARVYRAVRVDAGSRARALLLVVVACWLAAIVWTVAFHLLVDALAPLVIAVPARGPLPGFEGPLLDDTVYHTSILLAWTVMYLGLEHAAALQDARERALRAESEARAAQLRALRYQLDPHLLLNALNTVSTLVVEGRVREASDMISRLGEFLRHALRDSGAAEVPLADELASVRRYLAIEQARFEERLTVRFDVDETLLAHPVPALVLQPLVENAIRHAVAPRAAGGEVVVEARRDGGALVLGVLDDGPGERSPPGGGGGGGDGIDGGIGLANTRARLASLHGAAARVALIPRAEGGGTRAEVRLPLVPNAGRAAGSP